MQSSKHKRNSIALWVVLMLGLFSCINAYAQKKEIKIILMRHAEKELSAGANPPLTAAGKDRAERLVKYIAPLKPDAFYSTETIRTISTIEPAAKKVGKTIAYYDAAQQAAFAQKLKTMTGKTIVVCGHSNTIPHLANMLAGAKVYCDLPDDEFGVLWYITIDGDEATATVKHY